jgi:inosine/xanthosine triphosphate pyrophosphatase family protein
LNARPPAPKACAQFSQNINKINELKTLTVGGPLLLVQVTACRLFEPIQANAKIRVLRLEESISYNFDYMSAMASQLPVLMEDSGLGEDAHLSFASVPTLTGDCGSAVDIE